MWPILARNWSENENQMSKKPALPWYESNLLWGPGSFAVSFILTVIAATKEDLRPLLWLSWPFASVAIWTIIRATVTTKKTRGALLILGTAVVGFGIYKGASNSVPANLSVSILWSGASLWAAFVKALVGAKRLGSGSAA